MWTFDYHRIKAEITKISNFILQVHKNVFKPVVKVLILTLNIDYYQSVLSAETKFHKNLIFKCQKVQFKTKFLYYISNMSFIWKKNLTSTKISYC